MELFGYQICTPTLVYFVIALIITLVAFLLNMSMTGFSVMSSQSFCIVLCTIFLAFICTLGKESGIGVTIVWIIVALYICSASSVLSALVSKIFKKTA